MNISNEQQQQQQQYDDEKKDIIIDSPMSDTFVYDSVCTVLFLNFFFLNRLFG